MLTSLDGIQVLELGTTVVAPYTAQTLGAMGADVIKVEKPDGDPFRGVPPIADPGMSGYFAMCNSEKRSIALDLKTDRGLEILLELVEESDILIENFRPGTAEKLGFDYETAKEINDDIVYCSIAGYGQEGPWSHLPGFDPVLQGTTGLMSTTGEKDGPPVRIGVALIDLVTANWSVIAIMNALRQRDQTGESSYIDMSMHDVGVSMLTKKAAQYLITGDNPERLGTEDLWAMPYGTYQTKDGRRIMIGTPRQNLWEKLCRLIDREDLLDDNRFRTNNDRVENRDELNATLSQTFQTKTREEWLDILQEEIPVGPILTVEEALSSKQTEHSGIVHSFGADFSGLDVLNLPLRIDGDRQEFEAPPPWTGEQSGEILAELGYDDAAIESLRSNGVIEETAADGT